MAISFLILVSRWFPNTETSDISDVEFEMDVGQLVPILCLAIENSASVRAAMFNALKPEIQAYVAELVKSAPTPMGSVGGLR